MSIRKLLLGLRLLRRTEFRDKPIYRFNSKGILEEFISGAVNVTMSERDEERIQKYAEKDGVSLSEETSKIINGFFQSKISDLLFPILFFLMRKDRKDQEGQQ